MTLKQLLLGAIVMGFGLSAMTAQAAWVCQPDFTLTDPYSVCIERAPVGVIGEYFIENNAKEVINDGLANAGDLSARRALLLKLKPILEQIF